jgi:hypothetical protein
MMKRLHVGDAVGKANGDYRFDGEIRSRLTKLSGAVRFVVEDDRGVLHIFRRSNLRIRHPKTMKGRAS